jgi:hypothetical protein
MEAEFVTVDRRIEYSYIIYNKFSLQRVYVFLEGGGGLISVSCSKKIYCIV